MDFVIIDIHGHYTTEPRQLHQFRAAQLRGEAPSAAALSSEVSDDEVRESIEGNQLRVLRERGGDLMLFSPRASGMAHHEPDASIANSWAQASNDMVHRVSNLFPEQFVPVAQLPQTPAGNLDGVLAELRRSVEDLGFVGANLNPDPSGTWAGLPLTDPSWFPIFEAAEDLNVPLMAHVSTASNPNFHTLGSHYLNADTNVFMQLLPSDLFRRFPGLRLVIPHGGGAVPYHWGRYRGLAMRNDWQDPSELLRNVYFDTAVYHQPGFNLLVDVIPASNVLFASEMLGAVRGADPETGTEWDDTLTYLRASEQSQDDWDAITHENALRVYPRLAARLAGGDL
ncbi:amidohydrolase family protein [Cryobacterium sp. TMT1-66-1]|uniref:amidohydrolase family protein n=1 Tax=Cryobacterium sp. TMT1-66-1 TaxID=1259242 RepID=UPI001F53FA46|nr:amidohydrolase family protein [Cryobacterium sp. TMT1-66-1]